MDGTGQSILHKIQQAPNLTDPEKALYVNFLSEAEADRHNLTALLEETRMALDKKSAELEIEAALERIRERTMAMKESGELAETASEIFRQLPALGIPQSEIITCAIVTFHQDEPLGECWITAPGGKVLPKVFLLPYDKIPTFQPIYDGWKRGEKFIIMRLAGEELRRHQEYLKEFTEIPIRDFQAAGHNETYTHALFYSRGYLLIIAGSLLDAHRNTLLRIGALFQQTYTRFLDLQKAESLARDAQIEAALERVRSRAMAMHNSNDLSSAAIMVFTELRKLGIAPMRSGVGLIEKATRKATLYGATSSAMGDSLDLVGFVVLRGHPLLEQQYDSWLKQQDYFTELKGELLRTYYERLSLTFGVPKEHMEHDQYGYFLTFTEGFLFCWSLKPYEDNEIKVLGRFKSIIDLTFRRYMELQKSEASARDAVKQATLDRVRAEIASMRTATDLERITPLIWNELTILGIPFIRCGVFIMDEVQKSIHTFLSTPEGRAIAAFHIAYSTPGNISEVLNHWRHKKKYIDHWGESEFAEFADAMVKQGGLDSREHYLRTIPHGGIHLHFLPFLQGMLYVGNTSKLDDEEIRVIQSVAEAFSTAYARYEDFNRLEIAKMQVDHTLQELRQTQQQLIQSEKMASLGELTAGIAHEIQNPLNFVNNFSDLNVELLEEMKEEIINGNFDDVRSIANDVIENEEKINQHGKRADGIVKGMLQHSQASTGQKEPTDINVLADEYLRLAYHGLRAKDKSFNAKMITDFDKHIAKIDIMPQEIGRVLLNLINNAFYAVNEKRATAKEGYEPSVQVRTKKLPDGIELVIHDNGTGIPEKVRDKIFQPFFTTKPTGQSTGLGLSLSYDIMKAHGGHITVETEEGEGTSFIVRLPE